MRNVPFTSNVGGSELIGVVKNGKKFPFGTVSEETYNADLAEITERIQNVGEVAEHAVNTCTEISTSVDAQGVRITTAEHAIASQSQAIASLSDSISAVSAKEATDYAELTGKVNAAAGAVSSLEAAANILRTDFTALEHRVDTAEAAVSAQAAKEISDIAAVETAIDGLNSNLNALNTKEMNDISAVNARIDTVNTSVAALGNRIEEVNTSLTGAIGNVNTALNGVDQRVTDVNSDITDLQAQHVADMNAVNGRIDTTNATLAIARADIATVNSDVSALSNSVDIRVEALNRRIDEISGDDTIEIRSFTASPDVCEKGATQNVVLTWIVTGNVSAVKINNTVVSGNTYTATIDNDTQFTLEAFPEHGTSVVKTISVHFANHIFWGVSSSAAMDEGAVKALDFTELSDDRAREFSVTPNNQYIYYAYPKRLGASVFYAAGFEGGFTEPATVSIDNHTGFSEDYYVYRTENKISGTTDITVK